MSAPRWSCVYAAGSDAASYVLGAGGFNARRPDGRRVGIVVVPGAAVLTVTTPHTWDVERETRHPSLRAAKRAYAMWDVTR